MSKDLVTIQLSAAWGALQKAQTVQETKKVLDAMVAAEIYAKRQGLSEEIIGAAHRIKIFALKQLGEMLQETPRNTGARGIGTSAVPRRNSTPSLPQMGIADRKVSMLAQQIASLDDNLVRDIAERKTTLQEVKQVLKQERKEAVAERIRKEPLLPPIGPFRVIVIDPPWRYESRHSDLTHRARNPYPDMDLECIQQLPVPTLAHEDCIVWLWTTNAFLREAFTCLDAWGFEMKTMLTWVKPRMGLGDWLRGQTEHCMLATRGRPVVTLANQTTALLAPAAEHSRKPDEFYALVDALCPGNKLEMFARQPRPGYQPWGAEVAASA